MSNELSPWENATEGVTTVPSEVTSQDGYVLLLVLLSLFIGGTLVLLFGVLIICRHCCETDRRHSRASDDPEKTNTTYLDDSQPAQGARKIHWASVSSRGKAGFHSSCM